MASLAGDGDPDHMALYEVLNVPKEATEEQIKAAYRRLCQTYHPDKHTDPEKKEAATRSFQAIKDAHEVLSDPLRRRVYDEYGMDGVRTLAAEGMELSVWEDVRARFENSGFKGASSGQQMNERDSLLTVHNQVKLNLDGTGLVVLLEDIDAGLEGSPFIVTQTMLSSNLTAYVSNQDTIGVSYSIGTRGLAKAGGSNLSVTGRRQIDADTFAEASYMFNVSGRKPSGTVAAKLFRKISERSSSMLEATYGIREDALNLVLSTVRQFNERWMGQLAWITGAQNGVMCTFRHSPAHEGGGLVDSASLEKPASSGLIPRVKYSLSTCIFNVGARIGTFDTSLTTSIQKGLGSAYQDGGTSGGYAKLRAKVGFGLWDVELSGGRNLLEWNGSFGVGVSLGNQGVIVRFKISRSGHKFSVPVLVSAETRPLLATAAAALAISTAAVVQYHIVRPIKKARLAAEKNEARRIRKAAMEKARSDAEAALDLMKVSVERNLGRELDMPEGGLAITRAFFGTARAVASSTVDMDDVRGREIELELVDVTDAIQYLVEDSKVLLYSTNKASLMGIWDPTALEDDERALAVWYRFRGREHFCVVANHEPLEMPLRGHRLGRVDNREDDAPPANDSA